eukprot:c19114_g1_i1 orf=434-3724(+)
MTAAMDSPDRNPITASSDIQGSPFFHFLCSLSPIKPVRSGHGAQTFSELSFPPPPAVFVSPKADNQRDSTRSKRKILAGISQIPDNGEEKGEICDVSSSSQLLSDVEKESSSWRQATNCHQQAVVTADCHSALLCGSAPNSKTIRAPKDCSSEPEMKGSQHRSGGTADCKLGYSATLTNDEQHSRWEAKSFTSQDSSVAPVKKELGHGSISMCALPSDHVEAGESSFGEAHAGYLSHDNHVKMQDQSAQSLSCQTVPGMDKDTSSLSSDDLKKMAASWSVPVEYLSRILASMHGMADRDHQTASFKSNFLKANNESSNLHDDEELQTENVPRGGCKATTTGVRRRCLDFETSEIQHKALDNLPTLRMIGMSSDNPSRNALSTNLEANRAPTFSENNGLKYSGIENQFSKVWGQGLQPSSNLHVLPQYTRIPNPSLNSNATYLPSQHNTIINPEVSDPGLPLNVEPTSMGLHSNGLGCSMPVMTHSRSENTVNGGNFPYTSRLLPLEGFEGSLSPNEQSLLQGRGYTQAEYSGSLDQELLLSLVNRSAMIQREMLLASNVAHLRMLRPVSFYQSLALGIDPMKENNYASELENGSASLVDKSVILQETSHQSESDHQEDSTHSPRSPKKKRKLSTQTGDNTGEGCKNCKCKKSKCLKLYCECFAAGVYCIDVCNCNDCYNKPEFEEMVLGTRQQIESRNPLAFLPKIIRTSDTSPTLGEESTDTPASARHKRGCNCKKSQCLKKYCECYQAGVGCADGCRCEGCKNIYGRNEGSGELEDKDQQITASEMMIATTDESTQMDLKHTPEHLNDQQSRGLSPITPYLENSGQCRSDVELTSTERHTSPFEQPASTISLQSPSRILELLEETKNYGQVNLEPYQAACKSIAPDLRQLSPGWDGEEIYTLTPPAQPLQQLAPVLTDAMLNKSNACHPLWQSHGHSSPNISSHFQGLTNPDATQSSLIQQMDPMSFPPAMSQFQTPENALTVPITPLLSTTYASRPNYSFEEMSETRSHQSVWFTDEDDSPNVLRELNAFCAPNIVMKTRSPQQKRIFSYQQSLKSTSLRNNLSPGLGARNGRKIILHALPSSGYSGMPRDSV